MEVWLILIAQIFAFHSLSAPLRRPGWMASMYVDIRIESLFALLITFYQVVFGFVIEGMDIVYAIGSYLVCLFTRTGCF